MTATNVLPNLPGILPELPGAAGPPQSDAVRASDWRGINTTGPTIPNHGLHGVPPVVGLPLLGSLAPPKPHIRKDESRTLLSIYPVLTQRPGAMRPERIRVMTHITRRCAGGWTREPIKEMAQACRLTRKTVSKVLKWLVDEQMITETPYAGGRGQRYEWRVNPPGQWRNPDPQFADKARARPLFIRPLLDDLRLTRVEFGMLAIVSAYANDGGLAVVSQALMAELLEVNKEHLRDVEQRLLLLGVMTATSPARESGVAKGHCHAIHYQLTRWEDWEKGEVAQEVARVSAVVRESRRSGKATTYPRYLWERTPRRKSKTGRVAKVAEFTEFSVSSPQNPPDAEFIDPADSCPQPLRICALSPCGIKASSIEERERRDRGLTADARETAIPTTSSCRSPIASSGESATCPEELTLPLFFLCDGEKTGLRPGSLATSPDAAAPTAPKASDEVLSPTPASAAFSPVELTAAPSPSTNGDHAPYPEEAHEVVYPGNSLRSPGEPTPEEPTTAPAGVVSGFAAIYAALSPEQRTVLNEIYPGRYAAVSTTSSSLPPLPRIHPDEAPAAFSPHPVGDTAEPFQQPVLHVVLTAGTPLVASGAALPVATTSSSSPALPPLPAIFPDGSSMAVVAKAEPLSQPVPPGAPGTFPAVPAGLIVAPGLYNLGMPPRARSDQPTADESRVIQDFSFRFALAFNEPYVLKPRFDLMAVRQLLETLTPEAIMAGLELRFAFRNRRGDTDEERSLIAKIHKGLQSIDVCAKGWSSLTASIASYRELFERPEVPMVPPTLEKIQEMQRDWIAEDLAIWELTQIYAARELCNRGVPLDPANPEYLHALRTPRDLGTGTGDGPACGAAVLRCALSGNDPEVTKRDGARAREWLDQHPTIIPAMIIAGLPLPDEPAEAPRVTQRMLKWLAENERLTALQTLKQDLDHNPAFIQAVSEELLTAPRATKPIENP